MSDRDDDRRRDQKRAKRPSPPRPARVDGPTPRNPRSGEDARRRPAKEKSKRTKPTPVRAMAAAQAPPPPVEPDLEEAEVSVEDTRWLVRVVGRSGGGGRSATPLLLLGFWEADAPERERKREALVVGRALADLTPAALRRAFRESVRPPEPREARESGDRRRRGSRRSRRGR